MSIDEFTINFYHKDAFVASKTVGRFIFEKARNRYGNNTK